MTTTVSIVEENVTATVDEAAVTANITEAATEVSIQTGAVDHGGLTGLSDDDHTQYLLKAGGTMTGVLVLAGDPAAALQAATKQYVDAQAGATNLDDLSDVDAAAPTDAQVLTWVAANSAWEAADAAGGGGSETLANIATNSGTTAEQTFALDASTQLIIEDSSGTNILTVDEANQRVSVGDATTIGVPFLVKQTINGLITGLEVEPVHSVGSYAGVRLSAKDDGGTQRNLILLGDGVVVGADDPGGGQLFRVSGDSRFIGDVTVTGTANLGLVRGTVAPSGTVESVPRTDIGSGIVEQEVSGVVFISGITSSRLRWYVPGTELMKLTTDGDLAIKVGSGLPAAQLHVDQTSTTGAQPVLLLDQADVSEEFIKFIGASAADASQSLVDAADVPSPGSVVGWFKIYIQDDAGTGPIADGAYFVPFYSAPT